MIIQAQALLEYFDKSIPVNAKIAFSQLVNPKITEHFVFMGTQLQQQHTSSTHLIGNLNLEHAIQNAKNYQAQPQQFLQPSSLTKSSSSHHEDFFLFDNLAQWEQSVFSKLEGNGTQNFDTNMPLVYIYKQSIDCIYTKDNQSPCAFIEKYFEQRSQEDAPVSCLRFSKEQWMRAFDRYFSHKKCTSALPYDDAPHTELPQECDCFNFIDIFYQTPVQFHKLQGVLFLHHGVWNWLSLKQIQNLFSNKADLLTPRSSKSSYISQSLFKYPVT